MHTTENALADVIESLRQVITPTVANALEALGLPLDATSYSAAEIRAILPPAKPLVGFACTAAIFSGQPARPERRIHRADYWKYLAAAPGPKVVVMQDMSVEPRGAYWGEVNTNIHRALGCLGLITNGVVRDLDEVRPLQFPMLASGVAVSHACAHLENFDLPVRLGPALVRPGDLIHADQHGFIVIPLDLAASVSRKAAEIDAAERTIIDLCRSAEFSVEQLDQLISPLY